MSFADLRSPRYEAGDHDICRRLIEMAQQWTE
jgi:hypothetical protein